MKRDAWSLVVLDRMAKSSRCLSELIECAFILSENARAQLCNMNFL